MHFSICTELLCSSVDGARGEGGAGLFCISFSAANFVLRVFQATVFLFHFSLRLNWHPDPSINIVSVMLCQTQWSRTLGGVWILSGETQSRIVVDVVTVWGRWGKKKNTPLHPIRCSEPIPPSAQLLRPRPLRPSGLNPTPRCPWRPLPVTRRRTNCRQAWQLRTSEDWRRGWRSWRSQGSGWRWGRRGGPRWPPRCRSEPLRSRPSGRRRSGGACGKRRSSQHRCRCPAGGQSGWTPPRSRSSQGNCPRRGCGSGPVWTPRGPSERERRGRRRKIEGWEEKSTKENRRMKRERWDEYKMFSPNGKEEMEEGGRGERYKLRSIWIIYLHVSGNIFIDLPSNMQSPPLYCVATVYIQ